MLNIGSVFVHFQFIACLAVCIWLYNVTVVFWRKVKEILDIISNEHVCHSAFKCEYEVIAKFTGKLCLNMKMEEQISFCFRHFFIIDRRNFYRFRNKAIMTPSSLWVIIHLFILTLCFSIYMWSVYLNKKWVAFKSNLQIARVLEFWHILPKKAL